MVVSRENMSDSLCTWFGSLGIYFNRLASKLVKNFMIIYLSQFPQIKKKPPRRRKRNMCGWFHWVIYRFYANYHVLLALPGLRMWVSRVEFGLCRWCHTSLAPTPSRAAWGRTSGNSRIVWRCPLWSTRRPWISWSIASAWGPRSDKAVRLSCTDWHSAGPQVERLSHSPRSTDKCSTCTLLLSCDCQRCSPTFDNCFLIQHLRFFI